MHRILFFEGHSYAIYSYGFLLVAAMLVGMAITTHRSGRFGLSRDRVTDFQLALLLGGVVGARLMIVLEDWHWYIQAPLQAFNIRAGGLSWHGAVLGGFLGFLWYARRSGTSRGVLLDLATPGLVLAHAIGRIGCFLNGCCYGRPTAVPWGVTFPEVDALPRHPTQLYEAAAELLVVAALLMWERRRPAAGTLFYGYVAVYAVERFIVEFFRQEPLLVGSLDLAQLASFLILAAGLLGMYRAQKAADAAAPPEPRSEVSLAARIPAGEG